MDCTVQYCTGMECSSIWLMQNYYMHFSHTWLGANVLLFIMGFAINREWLAMARRLSQCAYLLEAATGRHICMVLGGKISTIKMNFMLLVGL